MRSPYREAPPRARARRDTSVLRAYVDRAFVVAAVALVASLTLRMTRPGHAPSAGSTLADPEARVAEVARTAPPSIAPHASSDESRTPAMRGKPPEWKPAPRAKRLCECRAGDPLCSCIR